MPSPTPRHRSLFRFLDDFAAKVPPLDTLHSNDDFMAVCVSAMSHLLVLSKEALRLPAQSKSGAYSKRYAPVVGLMVRAVKLFEGLLHEITEHRQDLAHVFYRPFLEALVKADYLTTRPTAIRSFIETSYRPEKDMLKHLLDTRRKRAHLPIETRMLSVVRNHLRDAKIRQRALLARKDWKLNGRDARQLFEDAGWNPAYTFGFQTGSHAVHGDWYDLIVHHLLRTGRGYHPNLDYSEPHPGGALPAGYLLAWQMGKALRALRLVGRDDFLDRLRLFELLFGALNERYEAVRTAASNST